MTIDVQTANFRAVRGFTVIAAVCDEIAFWRTDDSANPDEEILNGLRPGMKTVPGALLLCLSSPYARRGALWNAYEQHWGKEEDRILVWRADTRTMNPTLDEREIADEYTRDEAVAAAEYGAEFRRDIESLLTREAIAGCTIAGRRELPAVSNIRYIGFVDPSGGSHDSMTLAIAHAAGSERGRSSRIVVDALRESRPPFSPDDVVREFATLLKTYRIGTVLGDRYGAEWPSERFRRHGIRYQPAEQSKSELYLELLPLINSGQIELLDHPRLIAELCGLERRTTRGGRDTIDHSPKGHDDLANAVAGVAAATAAALATPRPFAFAVLPRDRWRQSSGLDGSYPRVGGQAAWVQGWYQ